jgi:hypothetical protein
LTTDAFAGALRCKAPDDAEIVLLAGSSGGHSGGDGGVGNAVRSRHHDHVTPPTAPISTSQRDRRAAVTIQVMAPT